MTDRATGTAAEALVDAAGRGEKPLAEEAEDLGNAAGCKESDAAGEGTAGNATRDVAVVVPPDLSSFRNARLRGGFGIVSITIAEDGPGTRGVHLGQTTMDVGTGTMAIRIAPGQSAYEQSVTIYHEVLEATALQAERPPAMVLDLSEEDFDLLAYLAQEQFGTATVGNLNKLLETLGY
jgi:hypothetical protein